MGQDVLGFATKSTVKAPKAVAVSSGKQKDVSAIQKNAGDLSDVVGQGADDSYKQFSAKQKQQQQQSQPKAKPAPPPKSLFSKVKSGAKSLATGVAHDAEKAANTSAALVGGTIGLGQAVFDEAHGNKKAAESTAAKTNKTVSDLLDKGMGGQGGILTSKQASSSGGGFKSYKENFVKPVLKGAAEYGQYVIPLGKAAKGASLLERVAKPAIQNAVVGAGGTAANEALDTGHVNVKDVAKGAAAGAVLGAGGQVLHEGLHASRDVTTKAASDIAGKVRTPKEFIQNAKAQSLLRAAQDKKVAAAMDESDKAVVESKKLDQQIELINAKKADGKFTNVDKVKVAQLKSQKEDLAPKIINRGDETPTTPAAAKPASAAQTLPAEPAAPAKSTVSESSPPTITAAPKFADYGPDRGAEYSRDMRAWAKSQGGAPTEGSLLSKVTTKKIEAAPEKTPPAEPGTRTLRPSETAHMPEIGGYTHSEHMTKDYADMLRGQEQSVKGGQMVTDGEGGYKRISEHSPFYRAVFKETGKAPTKADYLEEAKKELEADKYKDGSGEAYKQLLERESKPVERVKTESTVKDVPQGTSKVAQRIAKDIKEQYGDLAQYDKINIKDQASKAEALIADREKLDKVISGEEPLPAGLRATSVITAIRSNPELLKDVNLLKKLASSPLASESSLSAQELRLARENAANDPVMAIKSIRDARAKAVEKRLGKPVDKAVNDEVRQIKQSVPKVRPQDWNELIERLKC